MFSISKSSQNLFRLFVATNDIVKKSFICHSEASPKERIQNILRSIDHMVEAMKQ